MKKIILFVFLFFAGFIFLNQKYAAAQVPAYVCTPNTYYGPQGTVVRCGTANFCTGCDAYNHVFNCITDSNGFLPATIDSSTCTYVEDLLHEANAPLCASSCAPPPPVCATITCGTNSGAGGICTYSSNPNLNPKNTNVTGCTGTCPDGSGRTFNGFSVSVCQSNNCYYNDCTCYPNPGECAATPPPTPAPTFAPAPFCPPPPQVNNIRVTCPYCGT